MKKSVGLLFLSLVVFLLPAHAWNCSDPLAERVPVAAGTPGTFGDGDGQLFLGTGSEGTKGQLYECKVVTPKTPKSPTGGNSSATSTATSQSASTSNSASNSGAKSSATGGNSNATGGSATANGGNATGGNSNAGVSNSGNSSNTNNNTATGGTGGKSVSSATGGAGGAGGSSNQSQTQSTSSAATNNGNGSNNTSSITNVAASKIPVATAAGIAPPPTVTCFKGFGAGVQTMPVGVNFGGGKIDSNCAILETARSLISAGSREGYCAVIVTDKYVKTSGFSYDRCMNSFPVAPDPVVEAPAPAPVAPPVPVVINVQPTPPVVIPAPAVNIIASTPAPSVVVHAKPRVPRSNHKCVPTTCDKPVVFTNDGKGGIQAEQKL